jgi:hypothetical protein
MWPRILFALSLAFWLWYWIVQRVLGPFGADDTFFLHMFWMLKNGARQYTDFYSYHLPAYFALITPLLPAGGDLGFAWWFRIMAVLIAAAYAAVTRPVLWPFLFAFLVFGRMTEIRPDTIGLLLFNFAWLMLLKGRPNLYAAAALSALALLFSARAAIMMIGMIILLLWLARTDRRVILRLVSMGMAYLLVVAMVALAYPLWFETMLRSVFIDTVGLFPRMGVAERFLELERLAMVGMIMAALAAAAVAFWRDRSNGNAQVIAAACLSQMALIFADPLPYGYVYGWAMIPTLAGLALAARLIGNKDRLLPLAAFGSALAMLAVTLSYPLRNGPPAPDSFARLTPIPRLPGEAISRATTPQLVALILRPRNPRDQLAVREEICRRMSGTVATHFWYQPVCMKDAMHNWIGQTWTRQELDRLIATRPPQLIVWGAQPRWPDALLDGYSEHPGFAIRNRPDRDR